MAAESRHELTGNTDDEQNGHVDGRETRIEVTAQAEKEDDEHGQGRRSSHKPHSRAQIPSPHGPWYGARPLQERSRAREGWALGVLGSETCYTENRIQDDRRRAGRLRSWHLGSSGF